MLVLGMMARLGREFHLAQLFQFMADRGFVKRDGKFVVEPLDQIEQLAAHDSVDRRDQTLFDNVDEGLPLRIVQPRARAGRLAVRKSIGLRALSRNC